MLRFADNIVLSAKTKSEENTRYQIRTDLLAFKH